MLVLHASLPFDPDRREAALELVEDLVDRSRSEPGVVAYHATTDLEDPNVVRFFERYEDEAAFEAHLESDHYREFASALPDLLSGRPDVVRFDVERATEPDL